MDSGALQDQASRGMDGLMVDPEIVRQIRALAQMRWGTKRIARELGISRQTVRRYLRGGAGAEIQSRPSRRGLNDAQRVRAGAARACPGRSSWCRHGTRRRSSAPASIDCSRWTTRPTGSGCWWWTTARPTGPPMRCSRVPRAIPVGSSITARARAAEARHPQFAQSGLPPNWQGVIGFSKFADTHAVVFAKMQSSGECGGST